MNLYFSSMLSPLLYFTFLSVTCLNLEPVSGFSIGPQPNVIRDRIPTLIVRSFRHETLSSLCIRCNSEITWKPRETVFELFLSTDEQGSSTETTATAEEIDPSTSKEIRNIANHLVSQTVESILSQSDALAISNELFFNDNKQSRSSPIFNNKSYEQYIKYWNKVENRLREETKRTPADFLGAELTNRILSSIRGDANKKKASNYDAQTVRTFLESDAINSLFTQLLYDAIFEFTTKIDILGNAISNLPLLGPVRNQLVKESKRQMDRTLGPLVQRFLSGYTRVAIRQAVEFVVSEENSSAFGKANARLVGYLLEKRTVAEWIPEEKVLVEWREEAWGYLVGLEEEGQGANEGKVKEDQKRVVEQGIEWIYDVVGDKCLEDAGVDVNAVLDASPTLEKSLGSFWRRCQNASYGSAEINAQ